MKPMEVDGNAGKVKTRLLQTSVSGEGSSIQIG